ncbi:hypothetical protein WK00_23250 [Burkholderia ubonensis]|nr:hypothetical protein WK00_23250 [Burkholderia ubonensis]
MLFLEQIANHVRLFLRAMQVPADRADHVRLAGRSALAQRIRLDVLIEQFVRIQFGAVARQVDQSQALRVLGDELPGGNLSAFLWARRLNSGLLIRNS